MKNNTIIRGKKLSQYDLAYIAGLFDGEGCVNIYKIDTKHTKITGRRKNPRWELSTTIYNCDYKIIKWLYDNYGGYLQHRGRKNPKWKKSYAWKMSSNQAISFLKGIKKYLRIKEKQTELAIKFQQYRIRKKNKFATLTKKDVKFHEYCWLKMKKLNQRGEILPAETKRKDGDNPRSDSPNL